MKTRKVIGNRSIFALTKLNFVSKLVMKKLISLVNILLVALSSHAQAQSLQFIDSLDTQTDPQKTILLFTEFRDTVDDQTGHSYTQRSSYYFDWVHHELRYIETYDFDKRVKKRQTERAFRRNKQIRSSTHIKYTFFDNKLAKVGIIPSPRQCSQCSAEYYFSSDIWISKKEQNVADLKRNFMSDTIYYLTRLQIKMKNENSLTNKQDQKSDL